MLAICPKAIAQAPRAVAVRATDADEKKARAAGCDDYDVKPVELPRLLGKIAAFLA